MHYEDVGDLEWSRRPQQLAPPPLSDLLELERAITEFNRRRTNRRIAALVAVLLLLTATTLTVLLRDKLSAGAEPAPRGASPSATAKSAGSATTSPASVITSQWLADNAAPGARLLVPPGIARELDAALPLLSA